MTIKHGDFFRHITQKRGDSEDLKRCITSTVQFLTENETTQHKPGILLGNIQSGKTRAYLGVIALAFDNGFDFVVILTKGTNPLAEQTLKRVYKDFTEFIKNDQMQARDIMQLPQSLTRFELDQKFLLVVKKEKKNLEHCLSMISKKYPSLSQKRLLIIDDEADYASLSFRKEKGTGKIESGVISQLIDKIRELVPSSSFLQVTATPYSLYLQPEEDSTAAPSFSPSYPRRPAFTQLLPIHEYYIGGQFYFEESQDPASIAYDLFVEVTENEREALGGKDGRRLRLEEVLSSKNCQALKDAIITFIVAGCIRRTQQEAQGGIPKKYGFLFHTERSRTAHSWQRDVVTAIKDKLEELAKSNHPSLRSLCEQAYVRLTLSLAKIFREIPKFDDVYPRILSAFNQEWLMISVANSDQAIKRLLDEDGQLELRTPLNLFIGGMILDRGITVNNLIGFYYGRNPKRFQQDTTMQHLRIYGARDKYDLAVTRFYTTRQLYRTMQEIYDFDAGLRHAFETGGNEGGVYFVQTDPKHRIIPCSPNKLLLSNIVTLRPGKALLPIGFQTIAKTRGLSIINKIDLIIERAKENYGPYQDYPNCHLVPVEVCTQLLEEISNTLQPEDGYEFNWKAMMAATEFFSRTTNSADKGRVFLVVEPDRELSRYRNDGIRFSNAPHTKQQHELAEQLGQNLPVLFLFQQKGTEDKGWRGMPFWWPVLIPPSKSVTTVFDNQV